MSRFAQAWHVARSIVRRALRGMAQSPMVQLLAIGTMAVCLLLLGTVTLIGANARGITRTWGLDVPLTVYVTDDAGPAEVRELADKLALLPEVAGVEEVAPTEAHARLVDGLGGDPALLEGLDPKALPTSIEVHLRAGATPEFAPALADKLRGFEVVEDVAVLGPWVAQVEALLAAVETLAWSVGALVSLACITIVWSTIRLAVFARRAELQILRLVGGTTTFVRGPFVIEGVVQGTAAAALALAWLYAGFDLARPLVAEGLALLFAAGAVRFFTPFEIACALVLGGSLGALGAWLAVGRGVER
jgi:cell division transport system permease protein